MLLPRRVRVPGLSVAAILYSAAAIADARDVGPTAGTVLPSNPGSFLFNDKREVLITSGGTVFKSRNGGERWKRNMSRLVGVDGVEPLVSGLCQAPSAPATVYAVGGTAQAFSSEDGVFRSDDFGDTWRRFAPLDGSLEVLGCAVDPGDKSTVYVLASDQVNGFVAVLFKSIDGGESFVQTGGNLPPLDNPFQVVIASTDRKVYVVDEGTNAGIYVSSDGGATFEMLANAPPFPGLLVPHPTLPGVLFVLSFVDFDLPFFGDLDLYRSDDGGSTFTQVTGLPEKMAQDVAFDPNDPLTVYVAAWSAGLYRSEDGGQHFARIDTLSQARIGEGLQSVGVNGGSVYVSGTGGLFRSKDGGRTFASIDRGHRGSAVRDLSFGADGALMVGVLGTRGVFRETQPGAYDPVGATIPITDTSFPQVVWAIAASTADPNVILAASYNLLRTADGGHSWTFADVEGSPVLGSRTSVKFAPKDASRVYITQRSGFYRSDDSGQKFTRLSNTPLMSIAIGPDDADLLYLGPSSGGLLKSTDGGHNLQFLPQSGLFDGVFTSIVIDRRDGQTIYAGAQFEPNVIRSLDGGSSFESASDGLAGTGVLGLGQDSRGTLFAWLRSGGLFRSTNGANTWERVEAGEALRRSGSGRGSLVVDPRRPGRVYLGSSSVLQIDSEGDIEADASESEIDF